MTAQAGGFAIGLVLGWLFVRLCGDASPKWARVWPAVVWLGVGMGAMWVLGVGVTACVGAAVGVLCRVLVLQSIAHRRRVVP